MFVPTPSPPCQSGLPFLGTSSLPAAHGHVRNTRRAQPGVWRGLHPHCLGARDGIPDTWTPLDLLEWAHIRTAGFPHKK